MSIETNRTNSPELSIVSSIEEFLSHCLHERKLSPNTHKAYSLDLAQFRSFVESAQIGQRLDQLDKQVIRAFIKSLGGKKPRTIRRKIAALKSWFRFLEADGSSLSNSRIKQRRLPLAR